MLNDFELLVYKGRKKMKRQMRSTIMGAVIVSLVLAACAAPPPAEPATEAPAAAAAAAATVAPVAPTEAPAAEIVSMYKEAPMLAELVKAGKLPPVDERLPEQPFVREVISEVGTYGGSFNVFSIDMFPWNDLTEEPTRGVFPLTMDFEGKFLPDFALGFEPSQDHKTFTLFLRPGMKWSNGDPFTSADFVFKHTAMAEVWGNKNRSVEAPDEYTVIFKYKIPKPRTILDMVHWRGGEWTLFNPSEYLKKWHIDYNLDAAALAKEEGFATWEEAFAWHHSWEPLNDVNKPTIHAWMPVEITTTTRVYERNPYYHQVDSAGQQLPYVDRIVTSVVDPETYHLKIIAGESDVAYMFTNLENYPLYKENEAKGNYKVKLIPGISTAEALYYPNLIHPDPVRRELYNTREFRQALSVAINRAEINELKFLGLGKPKQQTVIQDATFYDPAWAEAYAQYDPDLANSMLDEIGLTKRNSAGIRLDSAGNPIVIVVEYAEGLNSSAVGTHELVREYWAAVGIDMQIRATASETYMDGERAMKWDFLGISGGYGEMYSFLAGGLPGVINHTWEIWRTAKKDIAEGRKTLADYEGGVVPGEEPPAALNKLFDLRATLQDQVFGSEQYGVLSRQLWRTLSEETYNIGTVGETPTVIVLRSNIMNMPDQLPKWAEGGGDLNYFGAQLFYKSE